MYARGSGGPIPMKKLTGIFENLGRIKAQMWKGAAILIVPALALLLIHGSAAARQQDPTPAKNGTAKPAATEPPIAGTHVDLTKTPTLYIVNYAHLDTE